MSNEACLGAGSAAGPTNGRLFEITGTLEELRSIAVEQEDPAILQGCDELIAKLSECVLNIVVVGQFKRGKTSLLNALIGSPVLPTAVLPLTSVVTVLRYGEAPRGAVCFEGGEVRPLALEDIGAFVTESGNPKNRKGVQRVEVFYPSEYLRNGVRLIDTPGIGSVYQHNTAVTYDFVPRIDAAVFITAPDPPLTPTEVELLSDIASQVPKVFLVLNKADLVDRTQLRDVADFVKRNLPNAAGGLPLFSVSSKLALEAFERNDAELLQRSGFPRFEEELRRFLRDDKEDVFLRAAARRLMSLILETEIRLKLEMQAILTPVDELHRRIASLEEVLKAALVQETESHFLVRGHLAKLHDEIHARLEEFALAQADSLWRNMLERMERRRGLDRKRLAAELDAELRLEIEQCFEAWLSGFELEVLEKLRQVTNRFETTVNGLIQEVRQAAGTLFGVDLHGLDANVELTVVPSEGYYTDSVLAWGLGSLPLLLPRPLFEKYVRRRLLEQVPGELERNATRRAYDLCRRLDQASALFHAAMKERLADTIRGIRAAMASALRLQAEGERPAREAAERLRAAVGRLDELRKGLPADG